ncbi:MAG: SDR family NAD(P)-dependent oxidoreductase [Solirubrobacterales bacterium]|nr:SDR family NAD(P)-dependent oxidoreductase [Solirubrobacterales bacterium]
MELTGKTAIVTGANGGLGEAFVKALANKGATVYAGVRKPDTYRAPNKKITPIAIDLDSRESIDSSIAANPEAFAKADVLVNNAGALAVGLLEELKEDEIYNALQVNLAGLIHLTKAVLPGMVERDTGYIVNNASFSGYVYMPMASVYAASKAGVVAFSESLRRELDPTGVNVMHLITPGVDTGMLDATEDKYGDHFDTSGWDKIKPDEWAEKMIDAIKKDASVVQPSGKTRLAILASRGPGGLLDSAASRMFRR